MLKRSPQSLLLALSLTVTPIAAQVATRPPLRVVDLHGTAWERGQQHGALLKDEIATLVERWRAEIQRDFGAPLDEFVERFLAGTMFDDAVRRWTPELLDEVRGIASGSGQPFDRMFVWQLIDEVWASGRGVMHDKCTAIGVDRLGEQPTLVAQNLDIPQMSHGFVTVLRIRDEARGLTSLVVTEPGLIAAAGLGGARIGVAVNTLLQLQPCRDGLPVAFVVRGLLQQPDHAAAIAFLQRIRHASGQNYIVGGPDAAPGHECSANKVVRWQPYQDAPFTFHTNNPLANDDFTAAWRERAQQKGFDPLVGPKTCPRLAVCLQSWTNATKPDVAAIKTLLSSRTSTPSIANDLTFASFVAVLGEKPELHIAPGRPDVTAFEIVRCEPDAAK